MSIFSHYRKLAATMAAAALLLASNDGALAQTPSEAVAAAASQPTYALIAAVGHTFHVVQEKRGTGSKLEPYIRSNFDVEQNLLNRIVLGNLDRDIGAAVPNSRRLLFSLPQGDPSGVAPSEREQSTINAVIQSLRNMPEHMQWDRLVVVTPAYRALDKANMARRLEGIGLFIEPLCQSTRRDCALTAPLDGVQTLQPDGKTAVAARFQAPYAYLCIWMLDPKTLAVLSKEEVFDEQKLHDPKDSPQDGLASATSINKQWIASSMNTLIDRSVHDAVRRSGVTASVEVRAVGAPEAAPAPEPRQ